MNMFMKKLLMTMMLTLIMIMMIVMMMLMMVVLITRACVRCQNPVGDAREVPTRPL